MRLWSFHPKYLDNIGLSRAINEGISGYKALTGQQKMWANHSQLIRFKATDKPEYYLQIYLNQIFIERLNKWRDTIDAPHITADMNPLLEVTEGQLIYEWNHYLNKLAIRNKTLYNTLKQIDTPEPHPIFKVIEGDIEQWEKVKP